MPRPRKTAAQPAIAPSKTSHLFASRKASGDRGAAVTSERIAADLDAFRKAGGRIEVLGTTRTLSRIGTDAAPAAPAAPRSGTRR